MLILLLCMGSCAYAAAFSALTAPPALLDSSPEQLPLRLDSIGNTEQHIEERNFERKDVRNKIKTSTRTLGAAGARVETLDPDDDAEVIPQQPQYPQYPQQPHHPLYPYYPQHPWQFVPPRRVPVVPAPAPGLVPLLPGGGVYVPY